MIDLSLCINLDHRCDRWAGFCERLPADWPFPWPERMSAVDGRAVSEAIPEWYGEPQPNLNHVPRNWPMDWCGPWGCLQSHRVAWKLALNRGVETVLILEDDAIFSDRFVLLASIFLGDVPDDWDWLYLGGEHLEDTRRPPMKVRPGILRGRNVNRTHAYILRRRMLEPLLQHTTGPWQGYRPQDYHLDHRLGTLHEKYRVYAPRRWLIGQAAGISDVEPNYQASEQWWNHFNVVEDRSSTTDGRRQAALVGA